MKTIPSAIATHIATRQTTLAAAMRITRRDGQVYAYTGHDRDVEISAVTYIASPGLNISGISTSAQLAVGNLEFVTPLTGGLVSLADILNRVWDNAAFSVFRYNWSAPGDGVVALVDGAFGEITLRHNDVVIELRDLRQYFQQPVGIVSSRTCRVRLGSTGYGACNLDLTPFTVTGTITGVTSNQVFTDSARGEADDVFGEGEFTFTSGNNAGYNAKIRTYTSGGVFALALPMYADVQVGDTYTAVYGCRKRHDTDCRDKFGNLLNFQGEPHRPGLDAVLTPL